MTGILEVKIGYHKAIVVDHCTSHKARRAENVVYRINLKGVYFELKF